jgi:capsule biosynthesis phosphatase
MEIYRYVIDLDGTLCSNTNGFYKEAVPFVERIHKLNKLYDIGHQIIIYTARGMGRFNNDVTKAKLEFEELTIDQLKLWGVKYNSLYLGKISGDFYVDDKGVNSDEFFANFRIDGF